MMSVNHTPTIRLGDSPTTINNLGDENSLEETLSQSLDQVSVHDCRANNNVCASTQYSDAESDDSLLEECSRICMCEKCMDKILPKGRVREI